jgi:hypothetical protein
MSLTHSPPSVFDPVQAAVQLGLKYGAVPSSMPTAGYTTNSVAILAKELELAYLNDTTGGSHVMNGTALGLGPEQETLSLFTSPHPPLPLKSKYLALGKE